MKEKNKIFSIDFLTFVVQRTNYSDEKHISLHPTINLILMPMLKVYPDLKIYSSKSYYVNQESHIEVKENSYIVTLYASYFQKNGEGMLSDFFEKLKSLSILFHFTRIDYQVTIQKNFQNLRKEFIKSQTKLKLTEYSCKNNYESSKYQNRTVSVMIYDKTKQLEALSKKKRFKAYIKSYQEKYLTEECDHSRLEITFRTKSYLIEQMNKVKEIVPFSSSDLIKLKQVKLTKKFEKILIESKNLRRKNELDN